MEKRKKIIIKTLNKVVLFLIFIIGFLSLFFIFSVLYTCLTDENYGLSVLERKNKYFEQKYFLEKKDIFDVGTITSKKYIDINYENGKVEKKLLIKSNIPFASFKFTKYDKSEYAFVVLSEEFSQSIKDSDTFLVTKKDYPYVRNGWLISGRYICVNKQDNSLSCIGMPPSETYKLDEENNIVTYISYEFVM